MKFEVILYGKTRNQDFSWTYLPLHEDNNNLFFLRKIFNVIRKQDNNNDDPLVFAIKIDNFWYVCRVLNSEYVDEHGRKIAFLTGLKFVSCDCYTDNKIIFYLLKSGAHELLPSSTDISAETKNQNKSFTLSSFPDQFESTGENYISDYNKFLHKIRNYDRELFVYCPNPEEVLNIIKQYNQKIDLERNTIYHNSLTNPSAIVQRDLVLQDNLYQGDHKTVKVIQVVPDIVSKTPWLVRLARRISNVLFAKRNTIIVKVIIDGEITEVVSVKTFKERDTKYYWTAIQYPSEKIGRKFDKVQSEILDQLGKKYNIEFYRKEPLHWESKTVDND